MLLSPELLDCAMSIESNGDGTVVRLVGELDVADAERVRGVLCECAGPTVVVDLGGLTFLDSAGLRALLQAREAHLDAGHRLVLHGAHPTVRRVFGIAGLGDVLAD